MTNDIELKVATNTKDTFLSISREKPFNKTNIPVSKLGSRESNEKLNHFVTDTGNYHR